MSDSTNASATAWVRSHLTALYDHAGETVQVGDVHTAFDGTFAAGCEVRLAHVPQTLQALKDDVASRRTSVTRASVAWEADVLSTNEHDSNEPAVVAGVFIVTRTFPWRIRAGPAQKRLHVHFSARLERDASVQEGDPRRITSYYYTEVDRTPPIHFAVPRAAKETAQRSDGQ